MLFIRLSSNECRVLNEGALLSLSLSPSSLSLSLSLSLSAFSRSLAYLAFVGRVHTHESLARHERLNLRAYPARKYIRANAYLLHTYTHAHAHNARTQCTHAQIFFFYAEFFFFCLLFNGRSFARVLLFFFFLFSLNVSTASSLKLDS